MMFFRRLVVASTMLLLSQDRSTFAVVVALQPSTATSSTNNSESPLSSQQYPTTIDQSVVVSNISAGGGGSATAGFVTTSSGTATTASTASNAESKHHAQKPQYESASSFATTIVNDHEKMTTMTSSLSSGQNTKMSWVPWKISNDDDAVVVPSKPNIVIDAAAEAILQSGKPYRSSGWIVQDVMAPPDTVIQNLIDFNNYKEMSATDILESAIYSRTPQHQQQAVSERTTKENVFVRMVAGKAPFFRFVFHIHAMYFPRQRIISWTLDPTKQSDIVQTDGYWHVQDHPSAAQNTMSRVYYTHTMTLRAWVPTAISKYINRTSLGGATKWLKKYCETSGAAATNEQYPSGGITAAAMSLS